MSMNIFEYATRNALRYASSRGGLTTEELWVVPLRSRDGFDLDAVARAAYKALKDLTEESFVSAKTKTPEHTRREVAFEIVKYVIEVKLGEEEALKKRAENKKEKEKMLEILAEKQAGALSALSEEDLKQRIAALGE
jgi:hypothetical protein